MRQPRANRRRRLPARLRSPDAPHPPGRRGPRPVPRGRVGRAAAPVRAPLHAAERRALLPDERAHRPRGELRRGPARRRRDAAAERRRPVPDDRDAARLRRQQGRLRERSDRGRDDLPLERQLLRAPRLRGRQPQRARLRPVLRAAHLAHARLRARVDPPRRPALRGARHPAPARPARRPGRRQARRARRHRHLLRRRPEPRARVPARPHPQPRRVVRAVAQPQGHPAVDRRGLSALAVVGPRQRAAAQRALPRLPRLERDREPRADRRADPVLHLRALRLRRGVGLLRAAGARRGR